MPSYKVHEAKSNLSKLLTQAAQGEEVIIVRGGEPVAKLVRYRPARRKKITLGWGNGGNQRNPWLGDGHDRARTVSRFC